MQAVCNLNPDNVGHRNTAAERRFSVNSTNSRSIERNTPSEESSRKLNVGLIFLVKKPTFYLANQLRRLRANTYSTTSLASQSSYNRSAIDYDYRTRLNNNRLNVNRTFDLNDDRSFNRARPYTNNKTGYRTASSESSYRSISSNRSIASQRPSSRESNNSSYSKSYGGRRPVAIHSS